MKGNVEIMMLRTKTLFLISIGLIGLSACITSTNSGTTNRGQPVYAKLESGQTKTITLSFENGRNCKGKYAGTAHDGEKYFPLSCSDGGKGAGSLSVSATEADVGNIKFKLKDGTTGTVRIVLGQHLGYASKEDKDKAEKQIAIETCMAANVSGKAVLAFRFRLNGQTLTTARIQLGQAKAGTVGFVVREAAIEAAYSANTESEREAALMGLAHCTDRMAKAQ